MSRPHQRREAPASRLVITLESVWAEIRRRHPDVPPVIVTVGRRIDRRAPRDAAARTLRLRALASRDVATPAVAELFIGGEGLAHGAVDVLGTLLHEAAHGVAATRGLKETSRASAYHNSRFRELGEELGLQIDRHPTIGWSMTTVPAVPAVTAAAYAAQVDQLCAAIVPVRESEHHARHGAPSGQPDGDRTGQDEPAPAVARSAPTYLCGCAPARRLRMAPTVYALADVVCDAYGQPFTAN